MATKRRELLGLGSDADMSLLDDLMHMDESETPGCLGKADLDEPLFILRGQDRCAPGAVRDWAHRATGAGCSTEKIAEAMGIAIEMEEWQARTGRAKWPD